VSYLVIAAIIIYSLYHAYRYRANRRAGLGIWVSVRGPWGTRIGRRF